MKEEREGLGLEGGPWPWKCVKGSGVARTVWLIRVSSPPPCLPEAEERPRGLEGFSPPDVRKLKSPEGESKNRSRPIMRVGKPVESKIRFEKETL